jgi:hypothetical protein
MHDAACIFLSSVDAAVDEKSGGLHVAMAVEFITIDVDGDDIGGQDIGPMDALWIDEEDFRVRAIRDGIAEMVANAFMETKQGGSAEGCGKVDFGLAKGFFVSHRITEYFINRRIFLCRGGRGEFNCGTNGEQSGSSS